MARDLWFPLAIALSCACGADAATRAGADAASGSGDDAGPREDAGAASAASFDIDGGSLPPLIGHDYIDLSKIMRVGRFRSALGHDYADSVERCRSMKHYFQPSPSVDWSSVRIDAPFDGTIVRLDEEWAGTQLHLRASAQPAFTAVIFHVQVEPALTVGSRVQAGQMLGHHVGSQTMSDVAVQVNTPGGFRLVSYFDLTSDEVMARYQARGVDSRQRLIITRAERDADPLTCAGEAFTTTGTLESWVMLN